MSSSTTGAGTFLDWLLTGDDTGKLQAIVDAQKADLAAGITYGVYREGRLIGAAPARYLAEALRDDTADALDVDPAEYDIRPLEGSPRADHRPDPGP
jgi:hypothetical protein